VTIRARGASMLPFLRDGDLVRIVPRPVGAVLTGDVVCYAAANALFLHRVVDRPGHFVVKGDAVTFADVVPAAEVLGLVTAVERHGRVRRMDTRAARLRNRVIASLSPLLSAVVPAGVAIVRRLLRRGGA
jgi:hypothetical protein